MQSEPPNRKRRWFQFSLRTLLIVVTLLGAAGGYVAHEYRIVAARKSWMDQHYQIINVNRFVSASRQVILAMSDVKQIGDGSSTVAVSKFLHFWNPRLFMIVDDGVIWKWVLAHHWLLEPIRRTREAKDLVVFGQPKRRNDLTCDLGTYLAVLVWAGAFVRVHPRLPLCFADYVRRHAGDSELPPNILEYEAAAMEWFLLGVVEIPPAGWTMATDGKKSGQPTNT